jgi:membrane dipeptidase
MPPPLFFDAHLDLAYLAVNGRNMLAPGSPYAPRDLAPHAPSAVTLPALAAGKVRLALGTIFTEPGGDTSRWKEAYPAGDFERAAVVGRAQLEVYRTWADRGLITLDRFASLRPDPGVGHTRAGMGAGAFVPFSLPERLASASATRSATPPLHVGILMENADPIRSPAELGWWQDRGLVAVGLAWAKSSRYAGGNTTTDGLTPAGREMIAEMDRLGVVHDASHLSDRAFGQLADATNATIIASHSNCRALLGDATNQRHLTDEQIRRIAASPSGVIGLNLYSKFLDPSAAAPPIRATLAQTIAHVEHICMLTGSTAHVGLGSDMDGGFAADRLPQGIDGPADLSRLLDALRASPRNWTDADLAGFAHANFARVLGL